jgi:hypothetical protein
VGARELNIDRLDIDLIYVYDHGETVGRPDASGEIARSRILNHEYFAHQVRRFTRWCQTIPLKLFCVFGWIWRSGRMVVQVQQRCRWRALWKIIAWRKATKWETFCMA